MSRLALPVSSTEVEVIASRRTFSNFRFVEKRFSGTFAIRRLFSQARSREYKTLVVEKVSSEGPVEDEVNEILKLFSGYKMLDLVRVSFWKSDFRSKDEISQQSNKDCIGYAILKRDYCPQGPNGKEINMWHVFESVIRPYDHPHNYVPCARQYEFRVVDSHFSVNGVLYCQQNGLNKSCAQVALRSICSSYLNNPDITFSQINQAAFHQIQTAQPWDGLSPRQIENVLDAFKIEYYSIHYPDTNQRLRLRILLKYQRLLYSGIEAGSGALLGFSMGGPDAKDEKHIIPVFGHTFNEDSWAPNALAAYFSARGRFRYLSSEAWMSSFIAHDDNFGSNLCIPYAFVERKLADYVVVLRPRGFAYEGFSAELQAVKFFYSLLPQLSGLTHPWLVRLRDYVEQQKVIIRTIPSTAKDYAEHLGNLDDWEGNTETRQHHVDLFRKHLPEKLWVVEVSIPDLFSTNLRKLGELLLDATKKIPEDNVYKAFVMARFPGTYVFFERLDGRKHPRFFSFENEIIGHTELLTKRPD